MTPVFGRKRLSKLAVAADAAGCTGGQIAFLLSRVRLSAKMSCVARRTVGARAMEKRSAKEVTQLPRRSRQILCSPISAMAPGLSRWTSKHVTNAREGMFAGLSKSSQSKVLQRIPKRGFFHRHPLADSSRRGPTRPRIGNRTKQFILTSPLRL